MRLKTLAFLAITTAAAGAGLTPALAQGVTTIDTPAELPPEQGHGMAMEMEGSTTWNQAPVEMPGSTPGFTSERR